MFLGSRTMWERAYLLRRSVLCCACLQRRQYFPRDGSPNTPPHPSCDFGWKDYCPAAFRKLRDVFSIDRADFMTSICGGSSSLIQCFLRFQGCWPHMQGSLQ